MMTQSELRAYYRDRAALRLTEETLAGLREYAAASDDDLERDIAALEETAREQAEALTARSAEVLATLEAVDDICRRTELRLHYSGEWSGKRSPQSSVHPAKRSEIGAPGRFGPVCRSRAAFPFEEQISKRLEM